MSSRTSKTATVASAGALVAAEGEMSAEEAARAAHLRYVSDAKPGYSRQPAKDGFVYLNPDGSRVADEKTIDRIRKLAVPPAYTNVWICRDANGHIQAVGRDARGRKQYRYHPRWRLVRDEAKYGKMLVFGRKLPLIRERVKADLARPGLPREKVLAAIVRLLQQTLMRIGNEEYAKTNKSFGLTTLRRRHLKVRGTSLTFDFRAKHGIAWHIELKDRRLATILRKLQDLGGQELFCYLDDDGAEHNVSSDDVNAYLRDVTGKDITAKDFRTWAATNLAVLALCECEPCDGVSKAKKNVLRAIEAVAKLLGNTPSICRKCYVHPVVLDGYLDGSLLEAMRPFTGVEAGDDDAGLTAKERAIIGYLEQRVHASAG